MSKSKPDLLVIGGGIFGLWAARHALKAGKSVQVYEKRKVGAGASGGFLGALMPHMPDVWNAKKQMQFEALTALPAMVDELEEEIGVDCGYKRCGRMMPLVHSQMVDIARDRSEGARRNWKTDQIRPAPVLDVLAPAFSDQSADQWLDRHKCTFGATIDNLSARINPRAYLSALNQYVTTHGQSIEEAEVCDLDIKHSRVLLHDGTRVDAGHILVAAGFEAYPLLQPYLGPNNADRRIGRGVKGQAVLLEFEHEDNLPIVYHDGAYIVPHKNNLVAIGSSSDGNWSGEPDAFDPESLEFYWKAIDLVPALADAPVVDRWAGVRPRNTLGDPWNLSSGTEPFVGAVPGCENLSVAIGGFKISLGIAHWLTSNLACCK